jgi:hypothetical protein
MLGMLMGSYVCNEHLLIYSYECRLIATGSCILLMLDLERMR